MQTQTKYKTKQGNILLEYMKSTAGQHITVNSIWAYF